MPRSRIPGGGGGGGGGVRIATGQYTGDGAATQAIVGVGFQPTYVMIYHRTGGLVFGVRNDQDGVWACVGSIPIGEVEMAVDMIMSLDADGFTVGDGTGWFNAYNIVGVDYTYICMVQA